VLLKFSAIWEKNLCPNISDIWEIESCWLKFSDIWEKIVGYWMLDMKHKEQAGWLDSLLWEAFLTITYRLGGLLFST
jgi:hypothetical protein